MRRMALVGVLCLASCTDTARIMPMDQAAMQIGQPTFEFVRQGLGRGPVTITMPDGEILKGEYQITENTAVGIGVAGRQMATAVATGGRRHTVVTANGSKTIMNCDAEADIGGHGSGICETNTGAHYRVMF